MIRPIFSTAVLSLLLLFTPRLGLADTPTAAIPSPDQVRTALLKVPDCHAQGAATISSDKAAAVATSKRYRFYLIGFSIFHTRAWHIDTDFLSFGVKSGNQSAEVTSLQVTDLPGGCSGNNGTYGPYSGKIFFDLNVAPNDTATVSYSIVNAGHGKKQMLEDAIKQGTSHALDEIGSDSADGPLPQPWASVVDCLIKAGEWVAFANCDGPVVNDRMTFSAQALADMTAGDNSRAICRRQYRGTDSAAGCGRNSLYDFTWGVERLP